MNNDKRNKIVDKSYTVTPFRNNLVIVWWTAEDMSDKVFDESKNAKLHLQMRLAKECCGFALAFPFYCRPRFARENRKQKPIISF